MGTRGPPGFWARIYGTVEKFMPWHYTGIYSSPEFKGHIPVVGACRTAPNNPPFSAFSLDLLSFLDSSVVTVHYYVNHTVLGLSALLETAGLHVGSSILSGIMAQLTMA
jgi:hypothetical protein